MRGYLFWAEPYEEFLEETVANAIRDAGSLLRLFLLTLRLMTTAILVQLLGVG